MTRTDLPRNLETARHVAAIATAFMLPLSTSGQAIAVSIFAVLSIVTLDGRRLLATMRSASAAIPVVLFLLMLAGVLWSLQPLSLAIKSVGPYAKLLLIPLLMATVVTSRQALQVSYGFLAACVILLALSWASFLWPSGPWGWFKLPGVPVKDNAVQSGFFALCAFGLGIGAVRAWSDGYRRSAISMIVLALLFFVDIFFIYISKTGVIMVAVLLGLFLLQLGGWRRALLIAAPAALIVAIALLSSAPAQRKLTEIAADIRASASDGTEETISTAARIDYWAKALGFIKQAPLIGHGTGSIKPLYEALEATRPTPYRQLATADPHNQFLHTTLQVGLIGGALLLAMWAAHTLLFIGRDIASALGLAVVLQNIVGSLFNSHLSTVTQGMFYCLAVGLLGALIRDKPRQ